MSAARDVVLQLSALLRLVRAFGPEGPSVVAASTRLGHLLDGASRLGDPVRVRFERGEIYVSGSSVPITEQQIDAVNELCSAFAGAGLQGLELPRHVELGAARAWLAALVGTGASLDDPRFTSAGIVAEPAADPSAVGPVRAVATGTTSSAPGSAPLSGVGGTSARAPSSPSERLELGRAPSGDHALSSPSGRLELGRMPSGARAPSSPSERLELGRMPSGARAPSSPSERLELGRAPSGASPRAELRPSSGEARREGAKGPLPGSDAPTPARGISGLPSSAPRASAPSSGRAASEDPAPQRRVAVDTLREGLGLLVEAALAFEGLCDAWVTGGIDLARLESAAATADALAQRLVEPRLDLALMVHRVRCRGRASIGESALHAAATAVLAATIGRGLELRGEAKRTLTRAALFAHLPHALAGQVPSPTPLTEAAAMERCQDALGLVDPRALDPPPAWWRAGWIAALEHRTGRFRDDGRPAHPAAGVIGVAAGFDALTAGSAQARIAPASPDDALRVLAKNTESSFDPVAVTILTAAVVAFR